MAVVGMLSEGFKGHGAPVAAALLILGFLIVLAACGGEETPPTDPPAQASTTTTAEPSPTFEPAASLAGTASPKVTPSPTPTQAPLPTAVPESSPAPTPEPGAAPTPTATPAPLPTAVPGSSPAPTSSPLLTPTPTPTPAAIATHAVPSKPTGQSTPEESDHILWIAADAPAILQSPVIKQLRSALQEFTLYDLDLVADLELLESTFPGLVEVAETYIEYGISEGKEETEYLAATGSWTAYYGEFDQQALLADVSPSIEMSRETYGGYDMYTRTYENQTQQTTAFRGTDIILSGGTDILKAAIDTIPGAFFPAPGEGALALRELGDRHMVVKSRTSPEGQKLESDFDLKELSAWDATPPWTALIQHALRAAPTAMLTLTLEGNKFSVQVKQDFDSESDATRSRRANLEIAAEVVDSAEGFPQIQRAIRRLHANQQDSEVSYHITLTGEEAEAIMFVGLHLYSNHRE